MPGKDGGRRESLEIECSVSTDIDAEPDVLKPRPADDHAAAKDGADVATKNMSRMYDENDVRQPQKPVVRPV